MDFSAEHAGFVVAAYAVAFVLLAGLAAVIVVRMRHIRRRLAELEAQGASRRAPARTPAMDEATGAGLLEGQKSS